MADKTRAHGGTVALSTRLGLLVFALCMAACAHDDLRGSPDEVRTRFGPNQGFEVFPCDTKRGPAIVVKGTGSKLAVTVDDPNSPERFRRLVDGAEKVRARWLDMRNGCFSGDLVAEVETWHDMDGAIRAVGAILSRHDLLDRVMLIVTGPWVEDYDLGS